MANEPFIYVDPVNGPFILLVSPDTSISRSLGLSNSNVLTLDGQPIDSASYALYAETSSIATSASHAIVSDTSSLARTALTASYVTFANVANKPTLVSSSAQVLNGTGIYSSSAQLPPGLVSSSAQINTGSFTGSFTGAFVGNATASVFGTASWAAWALDAENSTNAEYAVDAGYADLAGSASYVTFDNVANKPTLVSSSFQVLSGSGVYSSSAQIIFPTTSSYAVFAETASRATLADTASYVTFANVANKPTLVSSSAQINTGSFTGSFTGVLVGTASWATNAVTSQTASFVATASWARNAITASFVATASWSNRSTSASYADTARTASYVLNAQTASFVTTAQTASFVATASWARNAITASHALTALSSSYAVSASWSPASIDTYFAAYTNVTRSISPSNTWITASFETDGNQAPIWALAGNNGSLTCSLSGVYEVAFTANAQKTGGGAAVASLRVLKNGAEMTGSFSSVSITVNNIVQEVRSEFNGFIESGSGLLFQYAGSNANVRFTGYQTSALPAYNYSMKLVINKN